MKKTSDSSMQWKGIPSQIQQNSAGAVPSSCEKKWLSGELVLENQALTLVGRDNKINLILRVSFAFCGPALIVPEGYRIRPEDPPAFFYKEITGMAKHCTMKMFRDLYELKKIMPEARASGIRPVRVDGWRVASED